MVRSAWGDNRDREIQQAIKGQLWWNAHVDSDDVTVYVEEGLVTLTGRVPSWTAYREAEAEAYEGGALRVRNELKVVVGTAAGRDHGGAAHE